MPRPIPGGGPPPIPGGGGGGAIIPGAPTPCMGAAPRPIGTAPIPGGGGILLPRPRAMAAAETPPAALADGGGGPSTARLTTFSPRTRTKPSVLFSVRSSKTAVPPLFFRYRNSSASLSTKFKCLSKAKKVPIMVRPSCNVTRSRCSTYFNNLLAFPLGCRISKNIDGEEYGVRRDDKREMRLTDDWALGTVQRVQFRVTVVLLFH
jgi:hypothetical protein